MARLLVMAMCAAIIWLTSDYTSAPQTLYTTCGVVCVLLLLLSIAVWFLNPVAVRIRLQPALKLPHPVVFRGYDSSVEAIVAWSSHGSDPQSVQIATTRRILSVPRYWFTDSLWLSFVASLPSDLEYRLPKPSLKLTAPLVIVGYIALCVGVYVCFGPSQSDSLLWSLSQGAFNRSLVLNGDWYRALSYSWLHVDQIHLAVNVASLMFAGSILRRAFNELSLFVLLVVCAVISGGLGTAHNESAILVGASGALMGLFGFIAAAQHYRDQRLRPFHAVSRKKVLVVIIALELILSYLLPGYGGLVHVAGLLTGVLCYQVFERNTAKGTELSHRRLQAAILVLALTLSVDGIYQTWKAVRQPNVFAKQLLTIGDPVLTAIAGINLPDQPNATRTDIETAHRLSTEQLEQHTWNDWSIARTSFWLGNTTEALDAMRRFIVRNPDNVQASRFWLSLEQEFARLHATRPAITHLPAGEGAAWLISADRTRIARLRLHPHERALSSLLDEPTRSTWFLNGVTEALPAGSYGLWRSPLQPLPTRESDVVRVP